MPSRAELASDDRYDTCQVFRETGHGLRHRQRHGTLRRPPVFAGRKWSLWIVERRQLGVRVGEVEKRKCASSLTPQAVLRYI